MRYIVFVLVLAGTVAASCNFKNNAGEQGKAKVNTQTENSMPIAGAQEQESAPAQDTAEEYVDSFSIKMDSLMAAKIQLPPVYTHDVLSANDEASVKFTQLSKACNGKMKILVNSNMVAHEIATTIKAVSTDKSDLLLLIDKTYSMLHDIENVKAGLNQIIDTINKYKGVRLAVAFYGDKNVDGLDWFTFKNFETNYGAAKQYLADLKVAGGGDIPESVYDAFFRACDQDFWKSEKKCNIILVGDAPPLEKPLSDYSIDDVIRKAKERKIIMNFYPIIIMPAIQSVTLPPAEVATYKELKLITSLYPNPTRGHIDVGLEESGNYHMEIYNAAGEMVLTEEFFGISWSKDFGELPNGMYILRVINSEHKFELIKFILKR